MSVDVPSLAAAMGAVAVSGGSLFVAWRNTTATVAKDTVSLLHERLNAMQDDLKQKGIELEDHRRRLERCEQAREDLSAENISLMRQLLSRKE